MHMRPEKGVCCICGKTTNYTFYEDGKPLDRKCVKYVLRCFVPSVYLCALVEKYIEELGNGWRKTKKPFAKFKADFYEWCGQFEGTVVLNEFGQFAPMVIDGYKLKEKHKEQLVEYLRIRYGNSKSSSSERIRILRYVEQKKLDQELANQKHANRRSANQKVANQRRADTYTYRAFSDASIAHDGTVRIAGLLMEQNGDVVFDFCFPIGKFDYVNLAEYLAIIYMLMEIQKRNIGNVLLKSDYDDMRHLLSKAKRKSKIMRNIDQKRLSDMLDTTNSALQTIPRNRNPAHQIFQTEKVYFGLAKQEFDVLNAKLTQEYEKMKAHGI